MTISKYMVPCPCGVGLMRRGEYLCPECTELERKLAGVHEDEIVAQLTRQFDHRWFTVRMSGLSRLTVLALVRLGRLDVAKESTSVFNYRVKPNPESEE